ncbi:hypothetical protein [Metabacillus idriensis]|uniref:hypothetical protein n=1 Tax=Metabacillus idriensis TaxID=324768 RepID=UPI003D2A015B
MKYTQKDFNDNLLNRITTTEQKLKNHIDDLMKEYQPIFKDNLKIDGDFEHEGPHPFKPGYRSAVSIGIIDERGEMVNFHTVPIWECDWRFLGLQVSTKIPGSKLAGELLDESAVMIKKELMEFIHDHLRGKIIE